MKKLTSVLFILTAILFLTGSLQAAEKLAYIDLSRTFNEYNKTKDYDKKLTDKESSYISERDKRVGEFKDLGISSCDKEKIPRKRI